MSVTLGALVIAISTEFSVLLGERYRAERAAGHDAAGGAASGPTARPARRCWPPASTAIAGFAVLVALRHPDAARLRRGDGGRPDRVAARRAASCCPRRCVLAERGAPAALPARALRRARRRRPRGDAGGRARRRREPRDAGERPTSGPLGFDREEAERRWAHRARPRPAAAGRRPARPARRVGARARRREPLRVVRRRRRRARARLRCGQHAAHRGTGRRAGCRRASRLPPFAAPLAVERPGRRRERRHRAGQGDAGSVPACACAGRGCSTAARLRRARPGRPGVLRHAGRALRARARRAGARAPPPPGRAVRRRGRSAATADDLRALVRAARLGLPGRATTATARVANLYGVAVCPQVTYVLPRRRVSRTTRRAS